MKKVLLSLQNPETNKHLEWILVILALAFVVFENNLVVNISISFCFLPFMIAYNYSEGYLTHKRKKEIFNFFNFIFFFGILMFSFASMRDLSSRIFLYQYAETFFPTTQEFENIDPNILQQTNLVIALSTFFWSILILFVRHQGRKAAQKEVEKSPDIG